MKVVILSSFLAVLCAGQYSVPLPDNYAIPIQKPQTTYPRPYQTASQQRPNVQPVVLSYQASKASKQTTSNQRPSQQVAAYSPVAPAQAIYRQQAVKPAYQAALKPAQSFVALKQAAPSSAFRPSQQVKHQTLVTKVKQAYTAPTAQQAYAAPASPAYAAAEKQKYAAPAAQHASTVPAAKHKHASPTTQQVHASNVAQQTYAAPAAQQTHPASVGQQAHGTATAYSSNEQHAYSSPAAEQTSAAPTSQQAYLIPNAQQANEQQVSAPAVQQTYATPASQQTYAAPASHQAYSGPTAPQNYVAPASQQTYDAPASQQAYSAPAAQQTYAAPASQQTYAAPASQQAYSAPAAQQTYDAPASQQIYAAPASQQAHSVPTAQQAYDQLAYSAPAFQQTYDAPASQQAYSAPSAQQFNEPQAYSAPAGQQTYASLSSQQTYAVPASQQVNAAPAVQQANEQLTYSFPAGQQTYVAPAPQQTYAAPASQQAYSAPAAQQANEQQAYSVPAGQQTYAASASPQAYTPPNAQHTYTASSSSAQTATGQQAYVAPAAASYAGNEPQINAASPHVSGAQPTKAATAAVAYSSNEQQAYSAPTSQQGHADPTSHHTLGLQQDYVPSQPEYKPQNLVAAQQAFTPIQQTSFPAKSPIPRPPSAPTVSYAAPSQQAQTQSYAGQSSGQDNAYTYSQSAQPASIHQATAVVNSKPSGNPSSSYTQTSTGQTNGAASQDSKAGYSYTVPQNRLVLPEAQLLQEYRPKSTKPSKVPRPTPAPVNVAYETLTSKVVINGYTKPQEYPTTRTRYESTTPLPLTTIINQYTPAPPASYDTLSSTYGSGNQNSQAAFIEQAPVTEASYPAIPPPYDAAPTFFDQTEAISTIEEQSQGGTGRGEKYTGASSYNAAALEAIPAVQEPRPFTNYKDTAAPYNGAQALNEQDAFLTQIQQAQNLVKEQGQYQSSKAGFSGAPFPQGGGTTTDQKPQTDYKEGPENFVVLSAGADEIQEGEKYNAGQVAAPGQNGGKYQVDERYQGGPPSSQDGKYSGAERPDYNVNRRPQQSQIAPASAGSSQDQRYTQAPAQQQRPEYPSKNGGSNSGANGVFQNGAYSPENTDRYNINRAEAQPLQFIDSPKPIEDAALSSNTVSNGAYQQVSSAGAYNQKNIAPSPAPVGGASFLPEPSPTVPNVVTGSGVYRPTSDNAYNSAPAKTGGYNPANDAPLIVEPVPSQPILVQNNNEYKDASNAAFVKRPVSQEKVNSQSCNAGTNIFNQNVEAQSNGAFNQKNGGASAIDGAYIHDNSGAYDPSVQGFMPYRFRWAVNDQYYGNDFGQEQDSDINGITNGQYGVRLPDGRYQKVTYKVTPTGGYLANVEYDSKTLS